MTHSKKQGGLEFPPNSHGVCPKNLLPLVQILSPASVQNIRYLTVGQDFLTLQRALHTAISLLTVISCTQQSHCSLLLVAHNNLTAHCD